MRGLKSNGPAEISVKLVRDGNHAVLTVRDDGLGLPTGASWSGPAFALSIAWTIRLQGGAPFRVMFPLAAQP
ncbi:MAG TPA: hypothetical protein VHM01_11900 [Alphaproteobacteria bacterium]|nr:hypothetical protein [Alphaproteobacteria bacterium]